MSKIDSDFNVFDEWGNYIGKFTPAGGGEAGCFLLIALLTVGLIGFFIYMMIKLVVLGFEAAKKGERGKAFLYLGVAISPFILCFCVSGGSFVSSSLYRNAKETYACSATRVVVKGNTVTVSNEWLNQAGGAVIMKVNGKEVYFLVSQYVNPYRFDEPVQKIELLSAGEVTGPTSGWEKDCGGRQLYP